MILKVRESGAPDTIRTCNLCLRRATLYPAELRVRALRGGSPRRKPRAPQMAFARSGAGHLFPEALGLAEEVGGLGVLLFAAALGELLQQLLLPRREAGGGLDEELDHQVAALARTERGHAAAFEPDGLAGLGAFGNLDLELGLAVAVL